MDHSRIEQIRNNREDAAPIINELLLAGIKVEWIADLYNKKINYKDSIQILINWLPRINNVKVKEDIVRALAVPWAKSIAVKVLISEFKNADADSFSLKWAIANTLSVVADDDAVGSIIEVIKDSSHGKSREMLVVALGNTKQKRAEDTLINLLKDEQLVGHALIGIRKLKSKKAYPHIGQFTNHETTWIRNEAKRAIAAIEKAHPEVIK